MLRPTSLAYDPDMPHYDTHAHHTISWVDLAAKDLSGALEFYSEMMGWTSFNDGETPYHVFQRDEIAVGGVMELTGDMGEMPPVWSVYVSVADAQATCDAATTAGGAVYQAPFDIPDGGKIAVVADPAGSVICPFEGMDGNGLGMLDEPGAPCWFDCMSRDVDASIAFYETVFGWSAQPMPGDFPYTVFLHDGVPLAGTMPMPPQMPDEVPSHWVVNFSVDDADIATEVLVAAGGTVMMPPSDTMFGRSASVMDPWGTPFNIIDRSGAEASSEEE
jgi:predicted enzyme related to lactoylglutathione lyase